MGLFSFMFGWFDGVGTPPEPFGVGLARTRTFLVDLAQRRGNYQTGSETVRFLELYGAEIIEPTAFRPDPITHRHDYYYDALSNQLFVRALGQTPDGLFAQWMVS